ncbi:hypothetical protein ACB092_06G215500 [Castanea dentata]
MHGYWQAVMISFEKELLGSHGFSLIPPDGLGAVISANPRLLLPSASVLAYARKHSWSAIFEWVEEERGWFWHIGDYFAGWEKRVKVTNIFVPAKKSSAKSKSAKKKKGDDSSETCLDIVPFESDFPPMGNIVLESTTPLSVRTRSSRCFVVGKSRPIVLRPSTDAPPSSRTQGSKMKTSPPLAPTTTERRSKFKEDSSATHPILLDEPEFEAVPEPISVYHPTIEEISASMVTPMGGFFDGTDVAFPATAFATPVAAQGVPAEGVSETTPILAETLTPQEEVVPSAAAQTEAISPATPLVISTSDPFAALS